MDYFAPLLLTLRKHRIFHAIGSPPFRRGLLVALFLWAIAVVPLAAQEPPSDESGFLPAPRFTHLTNEDGLAQNRVTALLQDRQGFMWIGTGNGLSRFDGYSITTLRHDPDNDNSLGGNNIVSLMEARDGNLWVGTTDGGLTRYNPLTNTFTRYKHNHNEQRRNLGALIAYDAYEDQSGRVWFTGPGNQSLSWVDPTRGIVTDIPLNLTTEDNNTRNLYAIQEDSAGTLWITGDNALIHFDPATEEATTYESREQAGRLTGIVADGQGGWWISGAAGLYHFDTTAKALRLVNGAIAGGNDIIFGQDGSLWMATTNGLYQIEAQTGEAVSHFLSVATDPHSLSENHLNSLYQDRDGLIWSGTANNGVDRFDPDPTQFTFYHHNPTVAEGLAEGSVNRLAGNGNAILWAATDATLNEIALDSHRVTTITLPIPPAVITTLYPDSRGNLWMGVGQGRVLRYDPATAAITLVTLPEPPAPQTPAGGGTPPRLGGPSEAVGATRNVNVILEQADGSFLAGVARSGFYQIAADGSTSQWIPIEQAINNMGNPVPVPPDITAITQDEQGVVWVGYGGGILARLDLTVPTAHFAASPFRETGMIEDLHIDRSGTLWVATQRGLIRTNEQGEGITLYGEAEGLPSAFVVSIAEDGAGRLWLGTQNGLARLDPSTNEIQTFGLAEGVQEREFLRQSVWVLDDGRIAFGGRRGLTLFHPDQATVNNDVPTVILTDVRLFNESVIPREGSILSEPLWSSDSITLTHDQDIISFEFTGLGYRAPAESRYRYQMVGFDPAWNEVESSRRFATYTNLPAGNYTFRVQQQLGNGTWSEPGASLAIRITPAWWETVWFQGAVVGVTVVGLLGVLWVRGAQMRQRTAELEKQVALRTQELAESEARFRGLSTSTFEAVIIHDRGQILDMNHAARELFGYADSELTGQPLRTLIAPAFHEPLESRLRLPSQEPYEIEGITKAGTRLPLEVRDREIPFSGKAARVAAVRDLTSRRQIESQRERVAALEERERIGRELHDDLGQVIGYVAVQAQAALSRLAQGEMDETGAILRQLTDAAHEAHDDVRQYITGIRTPTPAGTFRGALERYLEQLELRFGLRVLVSYPDELVDSPMTPEVETQALRIIQEALTNIRKHAGVQQARLIFSDHADDIQIIITDEGRGFALSATDTTATPNHFGLAIMRERAEAVGGSLTVRSVPNEGTQVVVRLPRVLVPVAATGLGGLRVLVVDDHPLYLEGLRNLLAARGLRIVGVARDGVEAVERARTLRPDLILMDVDMPKRDGLEATRLIKAEMPATKIVMLTVAADEAQLFQALQYGASGYLLKDLEGDRFFQMLGDVVRGETVLSPNLAAQVISGFATQEDLMANEHENEMVFTTRQQEVLGYIARGLSNKEIAAALHISERTVKHHVGLMLERLNLKSRYELAHYAQTRGLRNSNK